MGVTVGRLAVESGIFPLYEVIDGRDLKITKNIKKKRPVKDYLTVQGRFKHLLEEDIILMQKEVDQHWDYLLHLQARQPEQK